MFSKEQMQKLIEIGLSHGADYAEVFMEISRKHSVTSKSSEVRQTSYDIISGIGIRLMKKDDEVYGSLSGIDFDKAVSLVEQLKNSFDGELTKFKGFKEEKQFESKTQLRINDVNYLDKRDLLLKLNKDILSKDSRIIEAYSTINQSEQEVLIANSEGVYQHDLRPYIRLIINALAKDDIGNLESSYKIYSAQKGYEYIKELKFEEGINEITDTAVKLLTAPKIKPGKMTVILDNGFGGVIFHEACGHPLEASAVARGLSPFTNKLGEQIASSCVSAYDDGTIKGSWGHINIDDEGNTPTKNLLIENGVLKGYMIDRKNSFKMNMKSTGCGRRQSYKYIPTSRMTSTFIAPGKNKKEDLFKDVKFGLYAKSLGGGQVSPATGEFNFGATTAHYIRDGKICELVKGAMLIGYGHEILKQIDMVADNCELGEGMCGAASGSIPVDVGQPTIRIQNLLVGGGNEDA